MKNQLSRRQFLHLAGLTGGVVLVAACSPAATQPTGGEQASSSAASEPVTIAWWNGYSTPTVQEVAPKVIGDFEAMHPNIKIEYELSGGPPGGGNLTEVLLARIAAGTPPETITLFDPPSQYGARSAR